MAHSLAMLMAETYEELGILTFDLLSSSLRFVSADKEQTNKSRWETSRFRERFLGAVKPLKLEIEKPSSSLEDTQNWLIHSVYNKYFLTLLNTNSVQKCSNSHMDIKWKILYNHNER